MPKILIVKDKLSSFDRKAVEKVFFDRFPRGLLLSNGTVQHGRLPIVYSRNMNLQQLLSAFVLNREVEAICLEINSSDLNNFAAAMGPVDEIVADRGWAPEPNADLPFLNQATTISLEQFCGNQTARS